MTSSDLVIETDETSILIKPPKSLFSVLILHGYGGSKEEMLPLGYALALSGIAGLSIDLPGHGGSTELFDFATAKKVIEDGLASKLKPRALVGHSLGARLALAFELPAVCLSPPMTLFFEGRRSELLSVLRVRRAREAAPFAGLRSVLLGLEGDYGDDALILYGSGDLKTVKDFAGRGANAGLEVQLIKDASHLDFISAPQAWSAAVTWLKERFDG